MKDVIFTCSKGILVIIVLLKVAFVFEFPLTTKVDTFSIQIAESEMEELGKLASEIPDEFYSSDPFHWGQSSHTYLLTHYTHLIQGAKAHIKEIITPPPRA